MPETGIVLSTIDSRLSLVRNLARGDGLRASIFRGMAWTTAGFAGSQVMRLASNLLMTRLLAPESFGVMAIVTVALIGLAMFSDIGLGPGVVRSPKIHDEGFLNTAWTMQVGRGVLLQLACCLFAIPAAHFYDEPRLAYLLPVAGLGLLISSFSPMQIYTLQRSMTIGRLVAMDLGAQAISLAAMVLAGLAFRSVWVLVLGALVSATIKTVAQWRLLPVHRHRFMFVRADARELIRFGGWIFVATLLAFGANSAGSLVLGKLASMEKLGLYAIASTLAKAAEQFYEQLSTRVLFPVYATLIAGGDGDDRRHILRVRLGIVLLFVPAMCLAAYLAHPLFNFLFDHRYKDAAWIFQVLLMGLVPSIISSTLPYLIARGSSVLGAAFSGARLVGFIGLILLGHLLSGENGVIVSIAALPSLIYLLDYGIQRANHLSDFRVDLLALSIWGATGALIWLAPF